MARIKYLDPRADLLRESSYSDAQILGYEKFWDIVRVEYAVKYDSIKEGKKLGFQQGLQQGIEKGRKAQALEIARNMKALHILVADIAKATGLTTEEIKSVCSLNRLLID